MDYKKIVNKTFVITGVAGFIGGNIAKKILLLGGKVIGIDNLSSKASNNIKYLKNISNFRFCNIDLLNYYELEKECKNIDYIIHQADFTSISESMEKPLKYINNNVLAMSNILEIARKNKIKRVIYSSSASVYGNIKSNPKSIYGLTKQIEENLVQFYTKQYKVNTIGLRYFNIYGVGQKESNSVINSFLKGILEKRQITVYKNLNIERDFVYIEDVVNAIVLACIASNKANGKIFNIGTGKATSLEQLIELIKKISKINNINILIEKSRKEEIVKSVADIEKSKKYLNYIPSYTLEEGLKKCIDWYIQN